MTKRESYDQIIEQIFIRYYPRLVLYAESFLHNSSDAEDLIQEQFIKIWVKRVPLNHQTLTPFLFRIVHNAAINHCVKRGIPVDSLSKLKHEIAAEQYSHYDLKAEQFIERCLQLLPTQTKLVIEKILIENNSYQFTAESLNVSVNTVKTLLQHGIKTLREQIQQHPEWKSEINELQEYLSTEKNKFSTFFLFFF